MRQPNDIPPLLKNLLIQDLKFTGELRMGGHFDEEAFQKLKQSIEAVLNEYVPTGSVPNVVVNLFVSLPSSLEGCIGPWRSEHERQRIVDASVEIVDLVSEKTDNPKLLEEIEDELDSN